MSDYLFFIITIATAILYHEMIWQNFGHDIKRSLQELTFKGIIFNFSPQEVTVTRQLVFLAKL